MRILRVIGFALVIVLGAVALFLHWAEPDTAPSQMVFVGGDIVTMAEPLVVEAMWISDGRIERLGSADDVRAAAGSDAKVVDLAGATLMPGFIEPHTHPLATALLGSAIDVSGFKHDSRAEVMETLREAMDGFLPQPWVIAFGWDPLMVRDLDPPTLAELDELSPDKPFVILTQMMHEAFANSAALRESGITRDTADPPGASFGRDENGELTGAFLEVNAVNYLLRALPALPPALTELLLRWQLADYASGGFTTIGVLGAVGRAEDPIGLLRTLADDPQVPVRSVVYGLPGQIDIDSKPRGDHDARFELRGVKFWMDGSPYTGGAAFAEPYEDTDLTRERLHLPAGHMGPLNYELGAFTEELRRFHRAGYHVAVHTQGERAVQLVLDAAEPVLRAHPWDDHRHRLEHNALITTEQIQRAKALGFELSFFTDHIYYYGDRLPELVGSRVERYMPVGTAFREGHRATIHSDNPMTPIGPLRVMQTSMLRIPRKGGEPMAPSERLTVDQALRAMTTNAARQLGVEEHRGSLEPGKTADLVMLSRNPFDTAPEQFDDIEVLGTWIDGQPVDTRKASRPNLTLGLRALRQMATR
ncbi:MAG: amidohydrolase [Deltaproteobacteria bacterium]|nr:amidohydrolase [Deltaproteobacteria bacterium]MBW2686917.1 amidohydrolase [Deltaproteobacteria bacterium]